MGFYLRKSIRVGPLRFNLSSSGIGVSAGIPGLRFGTGPRGNYVHMGRGGLYFRKTLGPGSLGGLQPPPNQLPPIPVEPRATTTPLQQIESASVLSLTDSSSAELLSELETKRRITRVLPFVLIAGIIAVGGEVASHLASWIPTVTALLFVFASWYAHQRDQLRKTTVVFYQFDPETERVYKDLHVAFEGLVQCSATWHVTAKADVLDRKYHAGASGVVTRARINVQFGEPPLLKTNIDVPMLPAGNQTLAFMPDRVLVFEQGGVGAVSYDALKLEVDVQQFVEDGSVPADSQTVGRTWRYVNKKGGPDRRFSYNPELPIAQYGLLAMQSPSGLNELFQSSQPSAAKRLSDALVRMASPAKQASASSQS